MATYKLINSITINSSQATASFSNIPQTYTDLLLVGSARFTANNQWVKIGINGSSSNYTDLYLGALGGSKASGSSGDNPPLVIGSNQSNTSANAFSNGEVYFPNYTNTSYAKPYGANSVVQDNTTSLANKYLQLWALRNSTTSAITSINISCQSTDSLAQYSTFYLYGIKNS